MHTGMWPAGTTNQSPAIKFSIFIKNVLEQPPDRRSYHHKRVGDSAGVRCVFAGSGCAGALPSAVCSATLLGGPRDRVSAVVSVHMQWRPALGGQPAASGTRGTGMGRAEPRRMRMRRDVRTPRRAGREPPAVRRTRERWETPRFAARGAFLVARRGHVRTLARRSVRVWHVRMLAHQLAPRLVRRRSVRVWHVRMLAHQLAPRLARRRSVHVWHVRMLAHQLAPRLARRRGVDIVPTIVRVRGVLVGFIR